MPVTTLRTGPEQTRLQLKVKQGCIIMRRSPVAWLDPEDAYQLADHLVDLAESIERGEQT